MKSAKTVRYDDIFFKQLAAITDYIADDLVFPQAAAKLLGDVYESILKRANYPSVFQRFSSGTTHPLDYYRIYVGKYIVFYTFDEETMYVRRIVFASSDYSPSLE